MVKGEIVSAGRLDALQQETEELIAIFTAIMKKVKYKDEGRRMKEEGPAWEVDETEVL